MYNNSYYDEYEENNPKQNKFYFGNFNLKQKLIMGSIGIIIIIIVLIVINSIKNYYNSYEYMEKKLIDAAQKFVNNSNFLVRDEIYLDVTKLGFEIDNKCSITSGVFVDASYNYKAYLECEDYTSDIIDNDESNVSLNGEEIIILGKDVTYIEQGVTSNNQASIQGEVGSDEGVYNLKYFISINNYPIILTRKVVVIDNAYINNLYPSLILNGDKIEYIQKGHKYQDEGVFASDVIDLDLGNKVKTTEKVNVNAVGEYEITYVVTNSRGYSNSISRKVVVVNNFSTTTITGYLSPETVTSGNVTINLKIVGNNYDYMILPDGSKTSSKTIEYPVTENGTYNFVSYDKDRKSITKIIPIENIDNTKPNATCIANVYNKYSQIYVTPYSGKKIESYNYIIDGVSSGNSVSRNYQVDKEVSSVSVILTDVINNTNIINCEIKVIDEVPGNNKVRYYTFDNQRYIIAKTTNNLDDLLRVIDEKQIYQSAKPEYWNKCLSFSYYHARNLYFLNDLSLMNNNEASVLYDSENFIGTNSTSKRPILRKVYEQITNGRPCIILMESSGGNATHYMTVVGYRDNGVNGDTITEDDLLLIDPNKGKLESPAKSGREMYRTPYTGGDETYYALYYLKDTV